MESKSYICQYYTGPARVEGYLKKLKHENSILRFLVKFTKRYFIVDLNEYFFGYSKKKGSSKILKHSLLELHHVDYNPRILDNCDWKFPLVVEIGNSKYALFSESSSLHKGFFDALNACVSGRPKSIPKKFEAKPTQDFGYYTNIRVVQDPNLDFVLPQSDDVHIKSISQGKTEINVEQAELSISDVKHQTSIKKESKETEIEIEAEKIQHETKAPKFENDDCIKVDYSDYIKVEKISPSLSLTENSNSSAEVIKTLKSIERSKIVHGSTNPEIQLLDPKSISEIPRFNEQSKIINRSTNPEIPLLDSKLIARPEGNYSNGKQRIESNNFGILDIIKDMDNLYLENVQIRPISEIKQKILTADSKSELQQPKFHTPRPPSSRLSCGSTKLISRRQKIGLKKLNFAEKLGIKQEAFEPVKPSLNRVNKPIYSEKLRLATPKPETDWDTWDN